VERDLGPIAVLVNVAGVLRAAAVVDCRDEDWAAVFDVNATGVFRLCRAVAPGMVARRQGAIVTVSSNAAVVARARRSASAAAKAAASHFTRCLGLELAPYGVRCNVVSPGSTDTDMLRAAYGPAGSAGGAGSAGSAGGTGLAGGTGGAGIDAVVRGSLALYRNGIPLLRVAQPDDIAAAVAFLASDHARHITMQDLVVDGGAALGA
jgi:2,3-dihydro-2,3-dihydroxybenzoate dehydrogenase